MKRRGRSSRASTVGSPRLRDGSARRLTPRAEDPATASVRRASSSVGHDRMPAVMGFLDRFRHGATSSAEESAGPTVGQIAATSSSKDDVKQAVPNIGSTLLTGVAQGIQGLTSLVFFLTFSVFGTFFLLKDGPSARRFVDRNLGVPQPVATTITGNVIQSLRRYFLGVTIVAAFNAVVVGLGAVALGVPLAGTIAVVVFVTAYVPFIGAFVSGAFAVILTLSSQGTTDAVVMLVIVILANGLLQNIVQPIAFGATLDLNPLVVLIVTIGAGSLFGMIGLVLGAPLTSAALHKIGRAHV